MPTDRDIKPFFEKARLACPDCDNDTFNHSFGDRVLKWQDKNSAIQCKQCNLFTFLDDLKKKPF